MSQSESTYIKGRTWGNLSLNETEIAFTGENKNGLKFLIIH